MALRHHAVRRGRERRRAGVPAGVRRRAQHARLAAEPAAARVPALREQRATAHEQQVPGRGRHGPALADEDIARLRRVERGEHWAILGPNGAGKTTLLKIVCGYVWPNAGGTIYRNGEADVHLGDLRRSIGWVTSTLVDEGQRQLAAGPRMLESGLANLRLALPPALIADKALVIK